jgi:hypothetical protein
MRSLILRLAGSGERLDQKLADLGLEPAPGGDQTPRGSPRGSWLTRAPLGRGRAPGGAGCRERGRRGPSPAPRSGRARLASSTSVRTSGSRCSSPHERRTPGSDPGVGRSRHRDGQRARPGDRRWPPTRANGIPARRRHLEATPFGDRTAIGVREEPDARSRAKCARRPGPCRLTRSCSNRVFKV